MSSNVSRINITLPSGLVKELKKAVPENEKNNFLAPLQIVDEMIKEFKYPCKEIDSYKVQITSKDFTHKQIIKFLQLHPQVKMIE